MNIVLVTTSFPTCLAGSEAAGSFVSDFALELANSCEVAVVAPGSSEEIQQEHEGMRIFRYRAPRQPLSTLRPSNPLHWRAIATTLWSGKRTTLHAAREIDADCILALWALPSGYWARNAASKLNIPYATWALGSDIWSLGRLPVVRTLLASVMAEAALRFADGYGLSDEVEKICGRSCKFLPSARQLPACGLPLTHKPPYRLAFLGRWHPNKGIDLLLDALDQLPDEDWSRIDMVRIAGGGPLEPLVQKKVEIIKRRGHPILLEGYKDTLEATELLLWSDLVMIPSRIESIPVIFSDALQARRRTMATPVGDFPRLATDPDIGNLLTLTKAASASSIAQTLRALLHEQDWPATGGRYGNPVSRAAQELVTTFSSVVHGSR